MNPSPTSIPAALVPGGINSTIEAYIGPMFGWVPCPMVDGHPAFLVHADLPTRIPLTTAEGRYLLARALGPACRWMLPAADLGELPAEMAQHSGALLACSAHRVAMGMGAVRGLLIWRSWGCAGVAEGLYRYHLEDEVTGAHPYVADVGRPRRSRRAPIDERAAVQAQAIADGYAVLDGSVLVLPWPETRAEVAP